MSALIFFIPALIAGVGVHSIQEFGVALFFICDCVYGRRYYLLSAE